MLEEAYKYKQEILNFIFHLLLLHDFFMRFQFCFLKKENCQRKEQRSIELKNMTFETYVLITLKYIMIFVFFFDFLL